MEPIVMPRDRLFGSCARTDLPNGQNFFCPLKISQPIQFSEFQSETKFIYGLRKKITENIKHLCYYTHSTHLLHLHFFFPSQSKVLLYFYFFFPSYTMWKGTSKLLKIIGPLAKKLCPFSSVAGLLPA